MDIQLLKYHLLKRLAFLYCNLFAPLLKINDYLGVSISGLSILIFLETYFVETVLWQFKHCPVVLKSAYILIILRWETSYLNKLKTALTLVLSVFTLESLCACPLPRRVKAALCSSLQPPPRPQFNTEPNSDASLGRNEGFRGKYEPSGWH